MPERMTLGNDLIVNRTYRPLDLRLERIHTTPIAPATTSLLDYRYTYGAKGNIASRQDPNDGATGSTATFKYDHLDRLDEVTGLTNAAGQDTTLDYHYDQIGNITQPPLDVLGRELRS